MFRIRRIFDASLPIDRAEIEQVQQILRERFAGLDPRAIERLPQRLQQPERFNFRSLLFVADDLRGRVHGFAMVFHDPELKFLYLDFIATAKGNVGSGVGGALYERVREEGSVLAVVGVFFECLPDDPKACSDPTFARQNASRLRFYERYGARPIVGTAYELPLREGQMDMPHLVLDQLDRDKPLRRDPARKIVRAILEQSYAQMCPPGYVDEVVASFRDATVQLRPARYHKSAVPLRAPAARRSPLVLLLMNTDHEIHHVKDRGYVEAPVRIRAIRRELESTGLFQETRARHFSLQHILAVHDRGYVEYFKRVCQELPEGSSVYPYVFPLRNQARPPRELAVRAGYYCIDTFTPLNQNALKAALGAVDCALTGAEALLYGDRLAYALVRPPGHHAERQAFGGFCYFNNAAIAAHHLSQNGRKIAILDIDYHHGNGQQSIFWKRADVLTVSIHGNPRFAYPYFSGFAKEVGAAEGEGYNLNLPLPETIDAERYRKTLDLALGRIQRYDPEFLVVSLGMDTAKGDPTGTWRLVAADFVENGHRIGVLQKPTLVVQEGGYRTRTLGVNVRSFFTGLVEGMYLGPRPGDSSIRTP